MKQPAGPVDAEQVKLFLRPDAKVPIGGKPATLIEARRSRTDPAALGRYFYDLVDDRMEYRKDKPGWGTGDAEWACDTRFGNCTDFHSLFISLARTSKLPRQVRDRLRHPREARRGRRPRLPLLGQVPPLAASGWIPVDISEANKHPEKRDYLLRPPLREPRRLLRRPRPRPDPETGRPAPQLLRLPLRRSRRPTLARRPHPETIPLPGRRPRQVILPRNVPRTARPLQRLGSGFPPGTALDTLHP